MSHDYELNVIIHRKRIFFSSFVRDFSAIFCCLAARSPPKGVFNKDRTLSEPLPLFTNYYQNSLSLLCYAQRVNYEKIVQKNVCKNGRKNSRQKKRRSFFSYELLHSIHNHATSLQKRVGFWFSWVSGTSPKLIALFCSFRTQWLCCCLRLL